MTLAEFRTNLACRIVDMMKSCVCRRCEKLHRHTLLSYPAYEDSECKDEVYVDIHTPVNSWMRSVMAESPDNFMYMTSVLYSIPEVVNDIDGFLCIAPILQVYPLHVHGVPDKIRACMEMRRKYPRMNGADMRSAEEYFASIFTNISHERCIISVYRSRGYDKIDAIEREWEMDIPEYTGYLQWMPREMIDEVIMLK